MYKTFAPLLRMILGSSVTGKNLKGTNMVLYYERSQHLGFLFARQIEYEKEFSAIVLQHINRGDLVFEIGSNIGQYALMISAKIGDSGKLICVEPDSDNFRYLSFNALKNNCKNIQLLNKAVSNREGKTTFYKDTVTGGRMGSLIREYSGTHFQGKSEEVEITTLKVLINHFGTPAFVKVDVEGAENMVFADSSSLSSNTTYLIEVREETKGHIFSLFHSKGFSIYLLERNMLKIEKATDIPGFANLIAKYPNA